MDINKYSDVLSKAQEKGKMLPVENLPNFKSMKVSAVQVLACAVFRKIRLKWKSIVNHAGQNK